MDLSVLKNRLKKVYKLKPKDVNGLNLVEARELYDKEVNKRNEMKKMKSILRNGGINVGNSGYDIVNKKYNEYIKRIRPTKLETNEIKFKIQPNKATKLKLIEDILKGAKFDNGRLKAIAFDRKSGGTKYYTITHNSSLIDSLQRFLLTGERPNNRSDQEVVDAYLNDDINDIKITDTSIDKLREEYIKNNPDKNYKFKQGRFFKYKHLINNREMIALLEELQIFYNNRDIDYSENCFIKSLIGQIEEPIILTLKQIIKANSFKKSQIRKLCESNNFYVKLHYYDEYSKLRYEEYGDLNSNNKAYICLIDNHYFKYIDDVGCTSYFIKNYADLKEVNKPLMVYKKKDNKYIRDNSKGINSITLVNLLLENKNNLLKECTESETIKENNNKLDNKKILNLNIDECSRLIKYKPRTSEYIETYIFDVETYINDNSKHQPYLLCFKNINNELKYYYEGDDCGLKFLKYFVNKYGDDEGPTILLYAHNSTYDSSFLINYFNNIEIVEKDNMYVTVKGLFIDNNKKCRFEIKDSYRMIPCKVSELGALFDIKNASKEVMYYEMYNYKTIDHITKMTKSEMDEYIEIFDMNSLEVDEDKKEIFYNNLEFWDCVNDDGTYNLMKYSRYYCEIDVEITKQAIKKFHSLWKDLTERPDGHYLNIYNYYSLPSLANDYFVYMGCFEGCYKFNGILSSYLMNFNHGGRVMMSDNQKQYNEGRPMNDLDAVSLYPSSMSEMDGYIMGKPKIIDMANFNLGMLKKWSYYFIKVKILEVGIKRSMPLFSKNVNGIKNWTNDVIYKEGDENSYYFFDRYQLEDAVEFHKIKYEVVEGYYFDEGFNPKIKTEIEKIFKMRLEAKAVNNVGLSNLLKLLMNSSYGKLAQKAAETTTKMVLKKDKGSFIINNYNEILSYEESDYNEYIKFEVKKSVVESYSMVHLSCQILSYSKRIMNKVICLGEDNGIKVLYQDTDSMHIYDDEVGKLEDLYFKKYGKVLGGKNLGQFHVDFEAPAGYKDAKSIKFIALGKKCYIDVLESVNDKGEKILSNHIRMKGIPTNAIRYKAKELGIECVDIFDKLYRGESLLFDLSVDNKVRFSKKCGIFFKGDGIKRQIKF